MKKILLSGLALGSCLLLASCGSTNESATITNLSNQLDRLNNVVANSATIDTNQINLTNYSNSEEDTGAIRNIYQKTEASITQQNKIKDVIKEKTASIKQTLQSKDIKLGKNTNAIRELSNSLSKYTTKLANTNNEYKKTANTISKMKNNVNTTTSDLGAKLTKLSSCSDTRSCYYNNLLNTLTQIEGLLNGGATVQDNILNNDYLNNYLMQNSGSCLYDTNGNAIQGSYCQNGTCYDSNGNAMTGYYFDANGNCVNGNCPPNKAYFTNQRITNNQYQPQNHYRNQNISGNQIVNRNMNNNFGNGVNNYNFRGRQFDRFNPSRNTDTYAPDVNNIDTYRGNPNNFGYNNTLNQSDLKDNTVSTNSELSNETAQNSAIESNKESSEKEQTTENPDNAVALSGQTQKLSTNTINQNNTNTINDNNIKTKENIISNNTISKNTDEANKPMLLNEDGRNDVSPKSRNLRFSERVARKNNNVTTQQNKVTPNTTTSLKFKPDYKDSNRKIKELIQSNAPTTETFNHFSIEF